MVRRIGAVILLGMVLATCSTGAPGSATPGGPDESPTPTAVATAIPTLAPSMTPQPTIATPEPTPQATATPTATSAAARCLKGQQLNAFAAGLLADLERRDAAALQARMGKSFTFVMEATDVAIPARRPERAVRELLTGLRAEGFMDSDGTPRIVPLARAARVRCVSDTQLDRATGLAILGRGFEAAFLASGWGKAGDEEAFVFLARNASGRLVWRGVWYSIAGFER